MFEAKCEDLQTKFEDLETELVSKQIAAIDAFCQGELNISIRSLRLEISFVADFFAYPIVHKTAAGGYFRGRGTEGEVGGRL